MKSLAQISLVLTAILSVSCSLQSKANAEIIDRILVIVDENVITQTDVVRFMPIYAQVFGISPAAFDSPEGCDELINDVVEFMIQATTLTADASQRELGVEQDEVDAYIAEQYTRLEMNRDQFTRELGMSGITYEDFEDFIRLNITRMRMIQLDVGARLQISDDEIQREILIRYPDGLEDTFIETSHIFVQVQGADSIAEQIAEQAILARLARLGSGESFESVAADNEDGTAARAGLVGRFSVMDLDQDYSITALGLEPSEVSEPVRSSFGFHIVRLESVSREPVDDVEQIQDRVHYDLHQARALQEEELYLDRVVNEAFVDRRHEGTEWFCGDLN
jgi:parvulin-like peptidyl-prolyl isomerase